MHLQVNEMVPRNDSSQSCWDTAKSALGMGLSVLAWRRPQIGPSDLAPIRGVKWI